MPSAVQWLLWPVIFAWPHLSWADPFTSNANYTVCFTPGQNCEAEIVDQINRAQHTVLVQAYSFTSVPILSALVAAKNRGVHIQVIVDKSQYQKGQYSSATFLDHHQIAVWVDVRPAIAHNKVMVIDDQVVITGSFNFTKAAQYKNAENVLIITDAALAKNYAQNWTARQAASQPLTEYHPHTLSSSSTHKNKPTALTWF